jgi:hypothetical protein
MFYLSCRLLSRLIIFNQRPVRRRRATSPAILWLPRLLAKRVSYNAIPIIQFMHDYLVTGFNADDGASLLMAFRGLQAESVKQGQAHNSIAKELTTLVADPFDQWAQAYKVNIYLSSLAYANPFDNRRV